MPQTRRLVARPGTRFKESFVTTPVCCPSRATLLTGQYAHNHGTTSNHKGYERLIDKENVLPVWLQQAGYRTAHVGKFLNGFVAAVPTPTFVPPGWDRWFTQLPPRTYYDYDVAVDGGEAHFGNSKREHLTRVLNRQAVSLVKEMAATPQPFYIQLDHFAPHQEWNVATTPGRCAGYARPAHEQRNLFRRDRPAKAPSFNERNVSDKPSFVQSRPRFSSHRKRNVRRAQLCALASLRTVDSGVRKIVEALDDAGKLGRTAILVTSDNGILYGEHRVPRAKGLPYEEAIRVPLVVKVPKRFRDGKQQVAKSSLPVANIDLVPTILELADADPCRAPGDCRVLDGRSLVPLLSGKTTHWPADRAIVIEYSLPGAPSQYGTCEYSGIRVPGASYIHHSRAAPQGEICEPIDETEVYDLAADPFQLENRFPPAGPEDQALASALAARHAVIRDCRGIAGRDAEPPGPTRLCE